jgi:hypothetical protein
VLSRWQRARLADIESELDTSKQDQERSSLELERDSLQKSKRLVMITKSIEPREIRVLPRGNWLDDGGPVVDAAPPEFLGSIHREGERVSRLDFANWLVDPEDGVGGLTARVFANRFWYLLFGRGISSSLTDFGGQGEPPSHPELLDQLAIDLIDDGWSVKRFMRRLVRSHAYRQSSNASSEAIQNDPYNRWFARQSRYRLPAEMVRDNALVIGGLLVADVGGPSIKPYQPVGYYRHLNFPKRAYAWDIGKKQYRRGVYVHWQRQYLHPMLKATDAPSREECTAQRPRSNTPLEALVMLNDPSMIEAAVGLADRLAQGVIRTDADRLQRAFVIAVSRRANDAEIVSLQQLLDDEREYYSEHPNEAQSLLESAAPIESASAIQLAAWTSVARAILNMYETVSRN